MKALCLVVACAAPLRPAHADAGVSDAFRAAEIATLLRQVEGRDDRDREVAAAMLLQCGDLGLERFFEALLHRESSIRTHATAVLRVLDDPSPAWVAVILKAAAEPSPERRMLLYTLKRLTWGDPALSSFWIGIARGDDAAARRVAFSWMASLPPEDGVAEAIASGLDRCPAEALQLLAAPTWRSFWAEEPYAGLAARARDVALETIERGDSGAKIAAAGSLGQDRSADARTIAALTRATRDPEWQVREAAWAGLADLVEAEVAPPETLASGFRRAPEGVLPRFVDAVYGKEARVVPGLRSAFARSNTRASLALALALVRAGVGGERPVIACIASWGPAEACHEALRSIPGALEVVRAATAWRPGETSDFTRQDAIRALAAFPAKEVKADLVALLGCDDSFVLEAAVQTMHRLGIGREESVAALTRMLRARPAHVRLTAARLLLDIGVRRPDQVRALERALAGPGAYYAAGFLGDLGAHAAPATPALCRALSSKDFGVRLGVARALAAIRPTDEDSYGALLGAAHVNATMETRRRCEDELRCAVWTALLAHPLLRVDDVAGLLRETALHSCGWWLDDLADVLRRGAGEETLRNLLQMLAEPPHRLFAVRLLARIAPGRAEIADVLLLLMQEKDQETRHEARCWAESLGLHRDLTVAMRLPELFPPFRDPSSGSPGAWAPPTDPRVVALCARVLLRATGKENALRALRESDPPAREAVPHLRALARRADPALRSQIERTIAALDG